MHAALMELPCFRSLNDALWFGVGTRHLLRDLARTDQGTLCIGICASLSSSYTESMAAEILTEMVSVSKAPVELTPSILEWKNLVHGVNGALHLSQFPRHAERLMGLFPTIRPCTDTDSSGPTCSSSSSLATALLAIGDVTRGAVEAITIAGGADAGWLAAVCEWLFGLKVQILREDGSVLYGSESAPNSSKYVQVLFLYCSDDGRSAVANNGSKEVQCLERVYYLEQATELIRTHDGKLEKSTAAIPRVSGRLYWETALSQAFRPEFTSLSIMQEVMGRAIGAAARALTALVKNEGNLFEHARNPFDYRWPRHSDAVHGRGFINNLTSWFPELEPLQTTMEKTLRLSYSDAKSVYETQISLVRNTCLCNYCQDDFEATKKRNIGSGFCKVVILETIIYLGQMLSSVSADKRLGLQRHGVERIYNSLLRARRGLNNDRNIQRFNGVLDFSIYYSGMRELQIDVLQLFTGETVEPASKLFTASAYSQAGICTYFHILCELSDSKELVNLIHITPGRIEFHGCPYDRIQDGEPLAMETRSYYLGTSLTRSNPERLMDLENRLKHLGSYEKPTMHVKQRVGGLDSWYESRNSNFKTEKSSVVVMQPGELAKAIGTSRGFIDCPGNGDCSVVSPGIEFPEPEKTLTVKQLGKVIHVVRGSSLMRCMAANGTQCEYQVLRRGYECIQCSVRAALASSRERVIIISD